MTDLGPTLVVSEVFGPTWQGEGASLGRRAGFVRLGRCNLACTWCDTPYTWRWADHDPAVELSTQSVADVIQQLEAMAVGLVVVTGGEPMVQQRSLVPLLEGIGSRGWQVEIETAGTFAPLDEVTRLVDRWNVSPKLAGSGNALEARYRPDALRALEATGAAAFKFVVTDPGELDEVDRIVRECGLIDVWVMPEGTDAATVVRRGRELADAVLGRGWNLTTRLHVLLWGDERGR